MLKITSCIKPKGKIFFLENSKIEIFASTWTMGYAFIIFHSPTQPQLQLGLKKYLVGPPTPHHHITTETFRALPGNPVS